MLTTNRVEAIDSAFMSRIHLSIAYPHLSPSSRREIWKMFITRSFGGSLPSWADEIFLSQVSETDLNGRRIKNAIRVAQALAANDEREMQAEDIFSSLVALQSFTDDFQQQNRKRTLDGEEYDASSKRRRLDL